MSSYRREMYYRPTEWGYEAVRMGKRQGELMRGYDMETDSHSFYVKFKGLPTVRFDNEQEALAYMTTVSELKE